MSEYKGTEVLEEPAAGGELVEMEAEVLAEADLHELASLANRFHAEAEAAKQSMVIAAWNAGQALLMAKELCQHGEWLPWLETNFHGTVRTAQRYMELAGKYDSASHLDPTGTISAALKPISEPDKKPRGTGKRKNKLPADKFANDLDTLCYDVTAIVTKTEKDYDYFAAVYDCIDEVVRVRDEITRFIKKMRGRSEDRAA